MILRWLISIPLLSVGAYVTFGNYWMIFLSYKTKRHHSLIPFLGGIFFATGAFVAPSKHFSHWWWAPLFVDIGCLPMLPFLIYGFLRSSWTSGNGVSHES